MYSFLGKSKLAFPGRAPGFDPAHPASQNCIISAIANGADYVNLISGKIGSFAATPTPSIDGNLGGAINFTSGNYVNFVVPTAAPAALTIATFFRQTAASSGVSCAVDNDSSLQQMALLLQSTVDVIVKGAQQNSSISLSVGVPYFVVVSANSGGNVNCLVLNLSTGQIRTQVISNTNAFGIGSGTAEIGSTVFYGGAQFRGILAPVVISQVYLSMQQMLAWAADPWSFWYPRTFYQSLDWLGKVSSSSQTYSLTGSSATFTFTGIADTENIGRLLSNSSGTFVFTGKAVAENVGRQMSMLEGTFVFSGKSDTAIVGRTSTLSSGTFVFTGKADTTNVGRLFTPSSGSFVFTGEAETSAVKLSILPVEGAFIFSGNGGNLQYVPFGQPTGIHYLPFHATVGQLKSF